MKPSKSPNPLKNPPEFSPPQMCSSPLILSLDSKPRNSAVFFFPTPLLQTTPLAMFFFLHPLSAALGFPVSLCTSSLKFSTSVLMISGANMWIIRILGFTLDIVWERLCMGSGDGVELGLQPSLPAIISSMSNGEK